MLLAARAAMDPGYRFDAPVRTYTSPFVDVMVPSFTNSPVFPCTRKSYE
jgi:hypothetical protein